MRSREGVPPKSGGAFQSGFNGLRLPQFRSEWNHEWNHGRRRTRRWWDAVVRCSLHAGGEAGSAGPLSAPADGEGNRRVASGLPPSHERHQDEEIARGRHHGRQTMRVCIVGASGKLGQYMVQHALGHGYEVVGVCREQSVEKLDAFKERMTVVAGATDDRDVIKRAVAGCGGVLVVLVPRGVHDYSSGTAQAVLDHAEPGARLVFSSGWHITRDGQDVYSWKLRLFMKVVTPLARLVRVADLDDQVEACRRVFSSDTRWTVVRGSDLEEGESQGLPVWSRHVGDPILESNLTRRIDFALFMVDALEKEDLVREAPAIVGCQTPSALAHAAYPTAGVGQRSNR